MKQQVASALYAGCVEFVFVLPFLFMIGHFIIGPQILWTWFLLLAFLLVIGILFRSKFFELRWWIYAMFALAAGIATGFIYGGYLLFTGPLVMIHTVFVYRGMMYVSGVDKTRIPLSYLWVAGFGIYFIAY